METLFGSDIFVMTEPYSRKERGIVTENTHTGEPEPSRLPSMSKLAIHQTTTYHWSLLEDVVNCVELGIPAIGLWRFKLEDYGVERSIDIILDSGLTVSSLSWAGAFTGVNGLSVSDAVRDTKDAIALASRLKAGCLVIADGGRNGHTWNHAIALLLDALAELLDFADEKNVTLALQPMNPCFSVDWAFLSTLEETLNIIEMVNHPRVQIAFDVWHLWRDPQLFELLPEAIPHVAIVQLNDSPTRPLSLNDRRLLGEGDIPLRDIMKIFREQNYPGYFEIALWSEDVWCQNYTDIIQSCKSQFASLFRK
ncbi:MAG: sugar phosphate isomerase/epimerase [Planctomycetaceae bacterium]